MSKMRHLEPYRLVELGSIALFCLFAALLPFANPFTPAQSPSPEPDGSVEACAIAMPNQGWAPLTVYFSAFGSRNKQGNITRYEWDLDGNGQIDFIFIANSFHKQIKPIAKVLLQQWTTQKPQYIAVIKHMIAIFVNSTVSIQIDQAL